MTTHTPSLYRKTVALLGVLLSLTTACFADSGTDNRAPDVPDSLRVSDDYKVSYRVFARGVQIYTAAPSAADPTQLVWTLLGPDAVLYNSDGDVVGRHFAYSGPTRPAWITESGSLVVGARTIPPVTVNPDAIPWLLLDAVHTEGAGVLKRTALIQRVNTTGGLAPTLPPTQPGQEVRVDYTAEYVFYRTQPERTLHNQL